MTTSEYDVWSEEELIERLNDVSKLLETVYAEIRELEAKENILRAELVRRKKIHRTDFADFEFYCWK